MKYSKILCGCVLSTVLFAGGIAMADDGKLQSTPEMLEKYKNTKVYYLTDMPGEIEDFEKAIKKNPLDPENYAQIAVRYTNKAHDGKDIFERGMLLSTAVDYYSKAIELNPYNYRYYELRASLLEKSRLYILASKDYAKAIELINNSCNDDQGCINLKIMYYLNFVRCTTGLDDKEEALNAEKVLLEGSKILSDKPEIFVAMGDFYKGNLYGGYKNYKKAIDAYNTALKINPNYAEAYLGIAYIYNLQEKFEKSIEYYTKAVENANDLLKPFYYKYRADCYCVCLKDYAKAKADYQKAIELFKTFDKKFGLSLDSPHFIAECEEYIEDCNDKLN